MEPWIIGCVINLCGSVIINVGTNLIKYHHTLQTRPLTAYSRKHTVTGVETHIDTTPYFTSQLTPVTPSPPTPPQPVYTGGDTNSDHVSPLNDAGSLMYQQPGHNHNHHLHHHVQNSLPYLHHPHQHVNHIPVYSHDSPVSDVGDTLSSLSLSHSHSHSHGSQHGSDDSPILTPHSAHPLTHGGVSPVLVPLSTDGVVPSVRSPPRTVWWYVGFALFFIGNVSNFISMGFTAQSLLAGLGSIQFITNVLCSAIILKHTVTARILWATFAIVVGNILIVVFADHNSEQLTVDQLWDNYTENSAYQIYCVVLVVLVLILYIYYKEMKKRMKPPTGNGNTSTNVNYPHYTKSSLAYKLLPFSYAAISAIVGTQSVLLAKSSSELVRTTLGGNNQFTSPFTYFILCAWILSMVFWLYRMNAALRKFDGVFIIPVLQVVWTLFSIIGGGIYFGEFADFEMKEFFMFTLGVCIVVFGVYLLAPQQHHAYHTQQYTHDYDYTQQHYTVNGYHPSNQSHHSINHHHYEMADFHPTQLYGRPGDVSPPVPPVSSSSLHPLQIRQILAQGNSSSMMPQTQPQHQRQQHSKHQYKAVPTENREERRGSTASEPSFSFSSNSSTSAEEEEEQQQLEQQQLEQDEQEEQEQQEEKKRPHDSPEQQQDQTTTRTTRQEQQEHIRKQHDVQGNIMHTAATTPSSLSSTSTSSGSSTPSSLTSLSPHHPVSITTTTAHSHQHGHGYDAADAGVEILVNDRAHHSQSRIHMMPQEDGQPLLLQIITNHQGEQGGIQLEQLNQHQHMHIQQQQQHTHPHTQGGMYSHTHSHPYSHSHHPGYSSFSPLGPDDSHPLSLLSPARPRPRGMSLGFSMPVIDLDPDSDLS